MKHIESVTSVCWVDAQHFISSGFDKVIYLWHINGAEVCATTEQQTEPLRERPVSPV